MKKNEKFAKNIIPAIALNVSYGKNMNIYIYIDIDIYIDIYLANISIYNLTHEKEIIILMIPIREGWHNLTAKKPSAFFIIKINNIKTFG